MQKAYASIQVTQLIGSVSPRAAVGSKV